MGQMPVARTYSVPKRPRIYEWNVISFITYEKQRTEVQHWRLLEARI